MNIITYPPPRIRRKGRFKVNSFSHLLFLLFVVMLLTTQCQRETLEPEVITLRSNPADLPKTGFFSGYICGNDSFKDFVVIRLQQMEQTRPFMSNFLLTRGTPIWNLADTRDISPNVLLLVPVMHPTLKKINAIMAFTGYSTNTTYSIIDLGQNFEEFIMAEDLLALYNQVAYGEVHPNIPKKLIPNRKSNNEMNYRYIYPNYSCWDVYTGGPGLQETYSYTFCIQNGTFSIASNFLPTITWPVSWSGGGGGFPNDPLPNDPPSGSTEIPKSQMKPLRTSLQKGNCPNQKVLQKNLWNAVTFYTNPNIQSNGGYDPINQWIFFRNSNYTGATMLHEMFHVYQHSINGSYPNKGAQGYVNIEFEAWVYTDMWALANVGWGVNQHTSWSGRMRGDYINWLTQILINPNLLKNQTVYSTWLSRFNQFMPEYSSQTDSNLGSHIIHAFILCNLITQ